MNKPSIYESLGVTPLINAAGTFTDLGGSLMSDEVVDAWNEASKYFVDLHELQNRVGRKIASMLGVESVLVTGGAASGIMLGTAAAITIKDDRFVQRHVVSDDGKPYEVLRQRSQRDLYDRQIEMCGVKLVDVDSVDDLSAKITDRTVMMMAYHLYEPSSPIRSSDWLQLAQIALNPDSVGCVGRHTAG